MDSENFGVFEGKEVKKFILSNGIIEAQIINYGGTVVSLKVPDNKGKMFDAVLGYKTLEEYVKNDGYFGATIGRVCNRIGGATFTYKKKVYNLGENDNGNSLHGGIKGFNGKVWDYKIEGESLVLSYESPDGEEGYEGNLKVSVKFFLLGKSFNIEYFAVSDKDTPVNLTNHSYFNLGKNGELSVLKTKMQIFADAVTPVDEKLIPNGEISKVSYTPFDFRKGKTIGEDIESIDEQMDFCGGYDINYVLNGRGYRKVAEAFNDETGITMSVLTDKEGMQFYSGNFITERNGKNGKYVKRSGFCLETQGFPNAVNVKNFPSIILKKKKEYHSVTTYSFE